MRRLGKGQKADRGSTIGVSDFLFFFEVWNSGTIYAAFFLNKNVDHTGQGVPLIRGMDIHE